MALEFFGIYILITNYAKYIQISFATSYISRRDQIAFNTLLVAYTH